MPYLGNSPVAGDHTNNFKVLDDISSYTETFDGSATTIVSTSNNTIRAVDHRFIQGQRVTYTNGGGGNIGGLTTGTAYFIIFDTASTFKLATSASNAANSVAINLSSVGSGSSHTLNAAFDGVNTKFKITYNSGTAARFNNATQLNIAINNVLQKPNVNSITFTEGFAIEDNHKIVFKIAPTNQDIFWGSIIANTLTTFDISDHKIDTFTGDGSTTEFTLSHTPANNESLMVTINGVLQHPSNASTARAYTLIASIIQFTAAPGVGDEIQVRHLGFAGATTADVSGFYGRTGNVVLTSNDHITTGNINAGIVTATSFVGSFSPNVGGSNANFTGIVTAGTFKGGNIDAVDGAFSGNVTIGGTLTYEDVTNIDSIGIITARDSIKVGSGVTIFSNGRAEFTGFTTFSGGAHIPFGKGLVIGPSSLYGQIGYFAGFSGLQFQALNAMKFSCWDGNSIEQFLSASGVSGQVKIGGGTMGNNGSRQPELSVAGHVTQTITMKSSDGTNLTERFKLSQSGFNFTGLSTHTGNFDLDGDLDVDGHTNLDNVSVSGVSTFSGIVAAGVGSTAVSLANGKMLTFGSDHELEIFHDGSQSYIKQRWHAYPSALNIISENSQLNLMSGSGSNQHGGYENAITCHNNGHVKLYYSGTLALQTTGYGAEVLGSLLINMGQLRIQDEIRHDGDTDTKIRFPASDTISFETAGGERLRIFADGSITQNYGNPNASAVFRISKSGGGAAELRFDTASANTANLYLGDDEQLRIRYGSTEHTRFDSSGRVMIGTTTEGFAEADDLTINSADHGGITIRTPSNKEGNIAFSDTTSGTGEYSGLIRYRHSQNDLGLWTNSNLRFLINSGGQVLIGTTTNPAYTNRRLTVYDSTNSGTCSVEIRGSSSGDSRLYFTSSTTAGQVGAYAGKVYYGHADNVMAFYTAGAERLRIDGNGAVGLNGANYGTAGQVLTSQGSGQPVEWRTIVQAPIISSITGNIFASSPGNSLTLTGQHFGSAQGTVNFSGGSLNPSKNVNVTPTSDTSMTVTVPSDVANNVNSGETITIKFTNSTGLIGSGTNTTVLALPSGGTITTSGNYRIHTFTSSSNFVLTKSTAIEYLVVAGGGGGGGNDGGHDFSGGSGGGGAGGYRTGTVTPSANTHTVTVGGGGSGNNSAASGADGSASAFGSITTVGGGGGGACNNAGENGRGGGSGGGAGGDDGTTVFTGGAGTSGQGNAGGQTGTGSHAGGGGGGGANATGGNAVGHQGGGGGDGHVSSINGSSSHRAGGGGGGNGASASQSPGGAGGGGAGAVRSSSNAVAGGTNTGGGGGGAADSNTISERAGANGGSGIVIVRYDVTNL